MMKKVFRPFWSYDMIETENWLGDMSKKGFHFLKFNRFTRVFTFQKGEPKTVIYEVGFERTPSFHLPKALVEDGWQKLYQNRFWYVMGNEKEKKQIKTLSVRESLIKKNRMHYYAYFAFLLYCAFMTFVSFHNLSFVLFLPETTVNQVVESPFWIITYIGAGLTFLLLLLSVFSVIKINRTNKDLVRSTFRQEAFVGSNFGELPFDYDEELKLKKAGKLLKKRKFAWVYEPDTLEKWLEQMDDKGYHLYHVARGGFTFYFLKGEPRKVSYCTEYQNVPSETSYFLHKENGWELKYSSKGTWQKWNVWAKVYQVGEEKPEIYSDKETQVRAARKVATTFSIMFWPVMILYGALIVRDVTWRLQREMTLDAILNFNLILCAILFLEFGYFTFRSWSYFYRMKKKYEI